MTGYRVSSSLRLWARSTSRKWLRRRGTGTPHGQLDGGHEGEDLAMLRAQRCGRIGFGNVAIPALELGEEKRLFEADVTAQAVREQGEGRFRAR